MKNLLIFESHKLMRQKSFYICLGVMVALLFLMALIQWFSLKMMGVMGISGYTWVTFLLNVVSNSEFVIVNGIFIALLVCNDFVGETIKNIYARGFSKSKVLFSKLICTLVATTVQFLCVVVFGAIFGAIFFESGVISGKGVLLIFAQWLTCLSLASFAFALSYTFKRTGVAIALSILAAMVIELILLLITTLMKLETVNLVDYWVSGFLTLLSNSFAETKTIVICIVLSIVYGAAFIAAAWFIDRKHDV